MSEPIIEQIAEWLVAAIGEITTANGYQQTLEVIRPEDFFDETLTVGDLTTIVAQDDPELLGPRSKAGVRWRQPFDVVTYFTGRGGTGLSVDRRINRVRSDIEKRVGTEFASLAGPNSLCSGLADDLEIESPKIGVDEQNHLTILVCRVWISYRTSATDPYTQ